MPILALKCQSCGSDLKINSGETESVCPVCHTINRIENTVHHNHTYSQNNYKIDSIEKANITLNDEKSVEKRIESANVFFEQFADYTKARELFDSVANDAPADYRGWWGLTRIETYDFNKFDLGESKFARAKFYVDRALKVVPNEQKSRLENIWNQYEFKRNDEVKNMSNTRDNIQNALNNNNLEYQQICEQINITDRYINENKSKLSVLNKKSSDTVVPAVVMCLIAGIILFISFAIKNPQFITVAVLIAIIVSIIFIIKFRYYQTSKSKAKQQINVSIARIDDLYNRKNYLSNLIQEEQDSINKINGELL